LGFFQDFFGSSAKKDLRSAKASSDQKLQAGYDEAQPFYNEAFDLFTPYAQQGQQANEMYGHAIGLGTDEQRSAAQGRYFSDPAMSAILDQSSNRLLRQMNARGNTYGGKAALAGARVGLEGYEGWLNRLSGQGQQGGQYAGQQAAIRSGQGDMRYGFGATQAGNDINFGNAMAQNRSTGVNNLLNLAGTVGKAVGTAASAGAFSDIRLKRDIERVGELPSGLPVYDFRYLWSDEPYRGVMAHEAAEIFPAAVSAHESGYLMVDYSRIN
jgi:hypothetical protein